MMTPTIEAEARLRAKNQLTVPEAIVEILEARQNDLLVFEANPLEPGTAVVRVVPRTFAGALTGVFGTTEEVKTFLREEHADWER
jgi:hypothetical protein